MSGSIDTLTREVNGLLASGRALDPRQVWRSLESLERLKQQLAEQINHLKEFQTQVTQNLAVLMQSGQGESPAAERLAQQNFQINAKLEQLAQQQEQAAELQAALREKQSNRRDRRDTDAVQVEINSTEALRRILALLRRRQAQLKVLQEKFGEQQKQGDQMAESNPLYSQQSEAALGLQAALRSKDKSAIQAAQKTLLELVGAEQSLMEQRGQDPKKYRVTETLFTDADELNAFIKSRRAQLSGLNGDQRTLNKEQRNLSLEIEGIAKSIKGLQARAAKLRKGSSTTVGYQNG